MVRIRFVLVVVLFLQTGAAEAQTRFSQHFNAAATHIENNNYSAAIEQLSNALSFREQASNNYQVADAFVFRGFCRAQLGNVSDAIADVNEGLKLKAEYLKAHRIKATIYLDAQLFAECLAACEAGLQKNRNDGELLTTKSVALLRQKKYDASREVSRKILEADPANDAAAQLIGDSYCNAKSYDSANVYYSKAIDINPLNIGCIYNRGIARSYTGDTTGARLDMETAMNIDTATQYIAYNNIGFFLKLERKCYAAAIPFFDKAIRLKPDFSEAYNNRGFAELQLDNLKQAYSDIQKALELDPRNSYAWKNYGLLCLKDNKTKQACAHFKKAVELGYTEEHDDQVQRLLKSNCGVYEK